MPQSRIVRLIQEAGLMPSDLLVQVTLWEHEVNREDHGRLATALTDMLHQVAEHPCDEMEVTSGYDKEDPRNVLTFFVSKENGGYFYEDDVQALLSQVISLGEDIVSSTDNGFEGEVMKIKVEALLQGYFWLYAKVDL